MVSFTIANMRLFRDSIRLLRRPISSEPPFKPMASPTLSGNLTPPRIAPSYPHCLCLWLDREFWAGGIIARQLAKAAFGWKGTARCLLWPSFMQTESAQAGFRASSALLFPFVRGPPADVISRRIFSLKGSNEAVEITPLTLFPVE